MHAAKQTPVGHTTDVRVYSRAVDVYSRIYSTAVAVDVYSTAVVALYKHPRKQNKSKRAFPVPPSFIINCEFALVSLLSIPHRPRLGCIIQTRAQHEMKKCVATCEKSLMLRQSDF